MQNYTKKEWYLLLKMEKLYQLSSASGLEKARLNCGLTPYAVSQLLNLRIREYLLIEKYPFLLMKMPSRYLLAIMVIFDMTANEMLTIIEASTPKHYRKKRG